MFSSAIPRWRQAAAACRASGSGSSAAQALQDGLAGQYARCPQRVAQLDEDRLAGVQGLPGAFEVALVAQEKADLAEGARLARLVADGAERFERGV